MFPTHLISSNQISRRQFMAGSAALVAATALAQDQLADRIAPRVDKVNIGVVGAGGRGAEDIKGCEGQRQAVDVIRSGAIGDERETHVWSDRPGSWWQQGIDRPTDTPPIPATLDWDTWLGPAAERPYNKAYVPFTWRGFWDFGTGA